MNSNENVLNKMKIEAKFEKFRTEPFKSSLTHFLETGKMSGNFLLELESLRQPFKDSNGNQILEGDKIQITDHNNYTFNGQIATVVWDSKHGAYKFKTKLVAYESEFDFYGVISFLRVGV